jgi:hypothetical protein
MAGTSPAMTRSKSGGAMNRVFAIARAIAIAGLMSAAAPSSAHALDKVSIVVFGPPSLGAFLQPVIKQFKLDEANGLAIDFAERTPDAYAAQFNSGEFQVGGSAAVLTVGLADARGVKVAYCRHLAPRRQDQGSGRQGSGRRAWYHRLHHVRLVCAPARC